MKAGFTRCLVAGVALSATIASPHSLHAAPAESLQVLWHVGRADNDTSEFALAPKDYRHFSQDGLFVVGRSDAKRDWPYVQPGPADAWADSRAHTFTVMFALAVAPTAGECRLQLDLVDTQGAIPPTLEVRVNDAPPVFHQRLPHGGGDASVSGDPAKGRECRLTIPFPAQGLRAGANTIALSTVAGSWLLYDSLSLEAPVGLKLTEASGTLLGSVSSPPVLVHGPRGLAQLVRITLRHLGDEQNARVRVGSMAATNLLLRTGSHNYEVAVPEVKHTTTLDVAVQVGDQTVGVRPITLTPVRHWEVYLLPHSHVDIGYTHIQTEVEHAQWKYIEMAIEAARKSADYPEGARFKWNTEVLWAVDSYWRQATPEKRAAFLDAVRRGWIGLDALYGNMLTGLCSEEELMRVMSCAQHLNRLTGVPITSAMITDVPGYTWGMVPAFVQNGVKYFSVAPNGSARIGHTSRAWGDKPFWWEGPNPNDRVLLWMTGTGYYQVFKSSERLMNYLRRLEEDDYPYDLVQIRHCLGDNGAPDVNFADTVRAWNARHAYPRLVIATTAEMFQAFEKRYGDKLPVARGDFTPYWEDGAASSARETALNRVAAERLQQAEALYALHNRAAYPADSFNQAWRDAVLYDEHTWGAHNSTSQPDAPFVKSQWAIKQSFALEADRRSRQLLANADAARGERVATPAPNVLPIDVVNTSGRSLPWALAVVPPELSRVGDAVVAGPDSTNTLPSQRLTTGELLFRPCIGSFMTRRYFVTDRPPGVRPKGGAVAEGVTLSSPRSAVARAVTLRLDERTGAIASLRCGDHELVDATASTALNDYFYLPGSNLEGLQRNRPVKISVKERGPLVASLLVESDAPGCRKLTREYRLHALRNYIEIINTMDKLPVREKEGVHFGFGFNVPDGVMRVDVPYGVVRPETDQLPGACRNWLSVQRFVDVSNKDYGVTWITLDAPLMEVGGITANLLGALTDSPLWKTHLDPSTTLYSWAMNNHWFTNYRADQEGPTVFRYVIWPHDRSFSMAQAAARARECTQPLLVLPARGESNPAPTVRFASNRAVSVTTLKPTDDGKGWIARLLNYADDPQQVEWHAPGDGVRAAWYSDASEHPLKPAGDTLYLPPFGLVTVRFN